WPQSGQAQARFVPVAGVDGSFHLMQTVTQFRSHGHAILVIFGPECLGLRVFHGRIQADFVDGNDGEEKQNSAQ
ncbi:hypothetical protein ACI394_29420, partial [Klebsiella pneumoniae]|uniref:hypothetical protein n=1 Tax=Klebsiella pneumoniae TaxID=573 RepID=UPI003851D6FC